MKLAPNPSQLQPIPVNVQPAVSENMQRAATQTDIQTIQAVQAQQQSAATQQNAAPAVQYIPAVSSGSIVLWVVVVLIAAIIAGALWLWKSF